MLDTRYIAEEAREDLMERGFARRDLARIAASRGMSPT